MTRLALAILCLLLIGCKSSGGGSTTAALIDKAQQALNGDQYSTAAAISALSQDPPDVPVAQAHLGEAQNHQKAIGEALGAAKPAAEKDARNLVEKPSAGDRMQAWSAWFFVAAAVILVVGIFAKSRTIIFGAIACAGGGISLLVLAFIVQAMESAMLILRWVGGGAIVLWIIYAIWRFIQLRRRGLSVGQAAEEVVKPGEQYPAGAVLPAISEADTNAINSR